MTNSKRMLTGVPGLKKACFLISCSFLVMTLLDACTSSKAISLPADFWNREKLNIGVALARASEPKVDTGLSLFGRPVPFGDILGGGSEAYDEGGEYSTRGGMESEFGQGWERLENREYGSTAKEFPAPSEEAGSLEERLRAMDAKMLMAVQKQFVQRLARAGYHAVPIQGNMGDDVRRAQGLEGYDALVIIDCRKYGVYCPSPRSGRALTSVNADMQARMIDLSSGTIIWQSHRIRARNRVSCRCEDAKCFPMIRDSLESLVTHAGDAMLRDLLENHP